MRVPFRSMVIVMLCLVFSMIWSTAQDVEDWVLPLLPEVDDAAAVQKLLDSLRSDLIVETLQEVVTFDTENEWENYNPSIGYARVQDGTYQILNMDTENVIWGQNETLYANALIDVEVEQLSPVEDNGYGVMCRANPDNNGFGYYFFISGDGFYRIAVLTDEGAEELVEWTQTPLIARGQSRNRLTVLCYNDQLALFINNQLAATVNDTRLTSGVLGMFGSIYEDDADVELQFDNLRVWSVAPRPDVPDALAADLIQGAVPIRISNQLLYEDFSEPEVWNGFSNGEGVDLGISSGVYRATTNQGQAFVYWGLSLKEYGNVVIQVETRDNSDDPNNGYGLTCRSAAMNNSNGYYLYISADGFYQLMRFTDGEAEGLIEWERSETINIQGENTLTAVCVDNYFALYANGVLLGEYTDSNPVADSGFVGVSIVGYEDEGVVASVDFDDYYIWAAERDN